MKTNMTSYERQYMNALSMILDHGDRMENRRTGISTIRIPHMIINVSLEEEFPILKSKFVSWKTAAKEILWIMQKQSNNINDLDAHIWDSWADETGSIGKAYGYQVNKSVTTGGVKFDNQVDYVLKTLGNDPSNRRCVINLWDVDDLNDMNLTPCCYSSIWTLSHGKLHCMLVQRSADFLVGVPFNTTQYAILTCLFAKHLGVKPGVLTHCMADAHIYCYDSHIEGAMKMLDNFKEMRANGLTNTLSDRVRDAVISNPVLKIKDSNISPISVRENKVKSNSFWDITLDDILVDNYKYVEKIKFDVAV